MRLGIPCGPRDRERLDRYVKLFLPRLKEIGWDGILEFKTDQITEDQEWVRYAVEVAEAHGIAIQWHVNDYFFSKIGRGLTVEKATEYLSRADWLVKNHACKIVMHFGTACWDTPDEPCEPMLLPLKSERYNSPIDAEEYLRLINEHVEFIKGLVSYYGDPSVILGENTACFLTGIAQYMGMQVGVTQNVAVFTEQTGIGTCLDIEHHYENEWMLTRRKSAGFIEKAEVTNLTDVQRQCQTVSGIMIEQGKPPYVPDDAFDINFAIELMRPKCFHIGGTVDSLDEWGVLNAHLPIDTVEVAKHVDLPEVVKYIMANGGDMIVEANGGDFWKAAGYACSPRIDDDEKAKWATLETTVKVIEMIIDGKYYSGRL